MKQLTLPLILCFLSVQSFAQTTSYTACVYDFCKGEAVEDISVSLLGSQLVAQMGFTNAGGCVTFNTSAIPSGETLVLVPHGELDPLSGVNANDLVVFEKLLLGIEPFTSTYQWIAADINMDNVVNTFDLILLQQIINGNYTNLPKNNPSRFFPKDFVFVHPDMPLMDAIPDGQIELVNGQPAATDFWAVRLGKVSLTDCNSVSDAPAPFNHPAVSIFPNPVTTSLHINYTGDAEHQYTLVNTLGQVVFLYNTRDTQVEIPFTELASGIYILNIHDGEQLVYTGKVVH